MNSIKQKLALMLAVVICLTGVFCLAGCAETSEPEVQTEPTAVPAPAIVIEEGGAPIEIATPYGILQYPSYWNEYVSVDENSDGDILTETFCCEIDGKQIELFTVSFGDTPKGELLGYVTEGDVKTEIRLEFHEFAGGLSQENDSKVYAMQEAVNDVIQSIKAFEGYSAQ